MKAYVVTVLDKEDTGKEPRLEAEALTLCEQCAYYHDIPGDPECKLTGMPVDNRDYCSMGRAKE